MLRALPHPLAAAALALALVAPGGARAGDDRAPPASPATRAGPGAAPAKPAPSGKPGSASEAEACLTASEEGQRLRDDGKLLAARDRFIACGRDACPALVRADCAGWLADVEERVPTIVLVAQDRAGADVSDVRVSLDGEPLAERLDGQAIEIDPGEHRLRFERAGSAPVEQRLLAREGDKLRRVSARFDPPAGAPLAAAPPPGAPRAAAPPPGDGGLPVLPLVLGGVAVAGGVAFALLGLSAQGDVDRMRETCAPACPEGDVDAAQAKMIGANVALGVGGLALGGAVLALVLAPSEPGSSAALLVAPAPGGVLAGAAGRF